MLPPQKLTPEDIKPSTKADRALQAAVTAKLRELTQDPISPQQLAEVSRFAQHARTLLYHGRGGRLFGPAVSPEDDPVDDTLAGAAQGPAETFGAAAIREITTWMGKFQEKFQRESLTDLVKAAAAAKSAKLTSLSERLQKEVMGRLIDDAVKQAIAKLPPSEGTLASAAQEPS